MESVEWNMVIGLAVFGGGLVLLALFVVGVARLFSRHVPSSPVPRYVPPAGTVMMHGLALRADRRVFAAAIVQMAVQKKVKLLTLPGKSRPVAVQVQNEQEISPDERALLQTLRPQLTTERMQRKYLRGLAAIGIHVDSAAQAPDVYFITGKGVFRIHQRRALSEYFDALRKRMTEDGLTHRNAISVHLYLLSLLALAVLGLGAMLVLDFWEKGDWVESLFIFPIVAALFVVLFMAPPPILRFTAQGDELRRELSGVRDYVRLAEQDRLNTVQSPQGALRSPAGELTPGGAALGLQPQPTAGDVVAQSSLDRYVLIERLLPYAILFHSGKAWRAEFARIGNVDAELQNLRVLGLFLALLVSIVQVLLVVGQLLRGIVMLVSLIGRSSR